MKHIIKFEQGHNCQRFECIYGSDRCLPGSGGSHGIHGLSIRFVSQREAGAVQFLLYTRWLPQRQGESRIGHRDIFEWGSGTTLTADLGYHSKTPRYEGQHLMGDACEYCDGKPCYYDGSGLNANDAMYALVNGGDVALWSFLDAYYAHIFDGKDYPKPAEYPKPLRKEKI